MFFTTKIFLICLMTAFPITALGSESCNVTADKTKEYLGQTFMQFDQTEGSGHRELGIKGCYLEAAIIMDVYHLHHLDQLETWQQRVLYFHSGQSYAQTDISFYSIAIVRFRKSFNEQQGENPQLAWNEYVHATIAFLEKDQNKLKFWRDKISQQPTTGNKINLKVVDAMIRCFDKPYRVVYSTECIAQQ